MCPVRLGMIEVLRSEIRAEWRLLLALKRALPPKMECWVRLLYGASASVTFQTPSRESGWKRKALCEQIKTEFLWGTELFSLREEIRYFDKRPEREVRSWGHLYQWSYKNKRGSRFSVVENERHCPSSWGDWRAKTRNGGVWKAEPKKCRPWNLLGVQRKDRALPMVQNLVQQRLLQVLFVYFKDSHF